MTHLERTLCIGLIATGVGIAHADVKQASADNFVIVYSVSVKAPPVRVYGALGEINRWWTNDHSYSGDAANLNLKTEAGACFCERWKDGTVEHGRVVMAMPDKMLRLASALGPLQGRAVTGILTFQLKPQEGGTQLDVSYIVNGSSVSALDKSAPPVDQVLGEQVSRLVRYVETGSPIAAGK